MHANPNLIATLISSSISLEVSIFSDLASSHLPKTNVFAADNALGIPSELEPPPCAKVGLPPPHPSIYYEIACIFIDALYLS